MSPEPTYPKDASIGGKPDASPAPTQSPSTKAESAPAAEDAKSSDPRRRKHLMAGAAIGIGSAAIVAALLYANRGRRADKD